MINEIDVKHSSKNLVIYGAGGLGKEILSLARLSGEWNVIGFIDDGLSPETVVDGVPVLGGLSFFERYKDPIGILFGLANPSIKAALFQSLAVHENVFFPNLIAPTSFVEPSAVLGEGCIIGHFCFVSLNVKLGRFVFLNTGSQVGHDAAIADFSSVMPSVNISGNVTVGRGTLLGVQSLVLQGLDVGENAVVGAGSRVFKDVPDNATVLGFPARVVSRK